MAHAAQDGAKSLPWELRAEKDTYPRLSLLLRQRADCAAENSWLVVEGTQRVTRLRQRSLEVDLRALRLVSLHFCIALSRASHTEAQKDAQGKLAASATLLSGMTEPRLRRAPLADVSSQTNTKNVTKRMQVF